MIKSHAHELLTRQEVKNLLDNLKTRVPALVEEVIPTQVKPGELQKVMQNLLRERVPVRDLETILETLGDYSSRTKDLEVLTEYVRHALARTICKQYVDERDRLWCLTLDPAAGRTDQRPSRAHRARHDQHDAAADGPADRAADRRPRATELTQAGRSAVLLCSPQIRAAVRQNDRSRRCRRWRCWRYNEIVPEVTVEAVALVD